MFLVEYLSNTVQYFFTIPTPLVKILVRKVKSEVVNKDDYVFHRGDEADRMYIIYHGTAQVVLPGLSIEDSKIYKIDNEVFGETALERDETRSADI